MITEIFINLLVYAIWCAAGYAIMNYLYIGGNLEFLPNVKRRWLYYLIQFTWGLTMNIFGGAVALVLLCCGKKPYRYGWNYCFELDVNFGLELGIFFIAPINGSEHTKKHEHGHAIQNLYFGPFCIGMVSIPSATRYWIREIQRMLKKPPTSDYDDVWFEGQATQSGSNFIALLNEKERK